MRTDDDDTPLDSAWLLLLCVASAGIWAALWTLYRACMALINP